MIFGQTPTNDPHWKLVWEDNFTVFDSTKWVKANYAVHLPEPQIYLTSNVYCENDNLVIKLNKNPVTCPTNPTQTTFACGLATPGQVYPYNSGWVETSQSYNTQFGYIEAKIKLPFGYGFWPAFWTWRGSGVPTSNETEIDIFEILGGEITNPNTITNNIHLNYNDNNMYLNKLSPVNFNYTNWHTYGIEWSPSKIIWYVDGLPVRLFPNHGIIDPARIIFNIAIDKNHLPKEPSMHFPPMYSPYFPAKMLVDYIKVYELKNDCNTVINACAYNFSLHDNKVKKEIFLGGGSCVNVIPLNTIQFLRAADGVLINGDFIVPLGAELYIDVNPCY